MPNIYIKLTRNTEIGKLRYDDKKYNCEGGPHYILSVIINFCTCSFDILFYFVFLFV